MNKICCQTIRKGVTNIYAMLLEYAMDSWFAISCKCVIVVGHYMINKGHYLSRPTTRLILVARSVLLVYD